MDVSTEARLLKELRVLEFTQGPSGSYAGRLFALSGANVTKLITNSLPPSRFCDNNKTIINYEVRHEKILSEPWDIVLWDNLLNKDMDEKITKIITNGNSVKVGIKLLFPNELEIDDESSLQAFAGWTELTGDPEKEPLIIGGSPASYLIGAHAATAGLASLLEQKWSEIHRIVKINITNILTSALEGSYGKYKADKTIRTRQGNRHNSMSPMAILPSKNSEYTFIGAPVDEQWEVLKRWSEISDSHQWDKEKDRFSDTVRLEDRLSNWTKTSIRDELFLTGQAFRMPFARVQTLEEVRKCPHLNKRKFFSRKDEKIANIHPPWKLTESTVPLEDKQSSLSAWKDLRILDLTSMWSGPYCTRIFADLGAEVIKVEAPHRPDGIRGNEKNTAPFFKELNRNKLGITLDLKMKTDREFFLDLVQTSDVIVENFSPRVMANFGLTKEVLWNYKPNLLIVSLSAFGQDGPYRDFVGYGPTLECMSGIVSTTHYADNIPWLPGFSISDIHAGVHGAFSLLASILFKEKTGRGLKTDVSQYEVACQLVGDYLLDDSLIRKQNDNLTHRTLVDVVKHNNLTNTVLSDGSITLGQPWISDGWLDRTQAAPEIGEHNDLLNSLINKTGNKVM